MSNTRSKKVASSKKTKKVPATTNNVSTSDNNGGEGFTAYHYEKLCENENFRYMPNAKSKKVGHAVIVTDNNGQKTALQYVIPSENAGEAPTVVPLSNIEEITRYGMTRYKATDAMGVPLYAKRFLHAKINDEAEGYAFDADIAYFSESEKPGNEPFWGTEKPIALFRDDLSAEEQEDFEDEAREIREVTKGGHELKIDAESVWQRDGQRNKSRKPDQNDVMGQSARDACEEFYNEMKGELTPEFETILKRSFEAPLKGFKGNHRDEWLHLYGHSLTPMSENPQHEDNLVAAPKWANTEMMVPERIVKWFAMNRPQSTQSINAESTMLRDSELSKHIHFEATVEENEKKVKIIEDIDPFTKYPLFRKASDLAQGTALVYSILNNVKPIGEQVIGHAANPASAVARSAGHATTSSGVNTMATTQTSTTTQAHTPAMTAPAALFARKSNPAPQQQHHFPTHLEHEKSIVEIITSSFEPNYEEPWAGSHLTASRGTGFVIEHERKKYIVTNAHCVENSIRVRVRLANDRTKKFKTTRKCVSYQADLALLEVNDPLFDKLAQPVTLGQMVDLGTKVNTIGFPMGGDEISISKGIASRIEVRDYCISGLDMLQVQIDAAVNPGNSGGPVFSDGKVVGVAFQGYSFFQGLSYMIPVPILEHFLKEAFGNKPYRGFPVLPIVTHTLENEALRKFHGMASDQTGVRIKRVDLMTDANKKLKPGDILLEIDSHPISNEGTVDIDDIGNCIDFVHMTHMKFIGDTVELKVIRKNEETDKFEIKNISVTLDHVPLETKVVPQTEFDKMPTFYIASGISFMPLTHNYVADGAGDEFESYYMMEEGCSLLNVPKKHENEQIIIINEILDCDTTEGYDGFRNAIVSSINGKKIRNIQDVVTAMESNKSDMHEITTSAKNTIVVRNLSKVEHDEILRIHMIFKDRSDDLNPLCQADETHVHVPCLPPQPLDVESMASHQTPGQRRFLSFIDQMEERYREMPESEDDEDYDADASDKDENNMAVESSSESSESEKNSHKSMERHRGHESASRKGKGNAHGFFKRKRDESSESESEHEFEPQRKRQRR